MTNKEQRRRELARAKWERQQRRRAERARRARKRRVIIAVALVVAVAAGGFGLVTLLKDGGDSSDQAADRQGAESTDASSTPSSPPPDPCDEPAEGEPSGQEWEQEPEMTIDTSARYVMELETTCGAIEIALDAEAAPHTVNSFHFLAGEGYFDHTPCHRLTEGNLSVLQCGDPTGTGEGSPGYSLPDENLDDADIADGVYPAGTVAMANSGPDTGGSQFFLVYQDSELSADYTPFGTVTAGMDVLEKIAGAGITTDPATGSTAPNATVVIDRATVKQGTGQD